MSADSSTKNRGMAKISIRMMSPSIGFRLMNIAPKLDAENYKRLVIGGLKGSSMLREMVEVSAVLLISGCAVGMALAVSIGRLNTEQSEQH